MTTGNPIIHFSNLTLGYDRHPAVHHLEHTVNTGELLAVVGPNGSGKSTLLKGIIGNLKPLEGEIKFNNIHPAEIAYLPQQVDIDLNFPISVFDMVSMGLWHKVGAFKKFDANLNAKIHDALHMVGLCGFESRPINALSGGQVQRCLFARLLLQDSQVILLDEPFAAIDTSTIDDLMGLINSWNKEGRTIIAVLHDFELVAKHFPETLLLARELVAAGKTNKVITKSNLDKANKLTKSFKDREVVCCTS